MELQLSRRTFIKTTVAGLAGLTLGIRLPAGKAHAAAPDSAADGQVTIWLNISEDNRITVLVPKAEMGQGVGTALPMILAEELEADWQTIASERVGETGPYSISGMPITAGSTSISGLYQPFREIGAAAKEMLLTACANRLSVARESLTAKNSTVTHPLLGSLTYGQLAADAARLPVPKSPVLKDPNDFTIIGQPLARLDTPANIEGRSMYGIDVVVPGMLYAAVRQSPVFGGKVMNFYALSLAGTDAADGTIVKIPGGIAVVAKSWWQAKRAVQSLDIKFSIPLKMRNLNSDGISAQYTRDLTARGTTQKRRGLPWVAMSGAAVKAEAVYEAPYCAHASMEPLCCTASVTARSCEIWVPTQGATLVQAAAKAATGLKASAITVHATCLGGAFGRKATSDYVTHAVLASKAVGKPVKVIWSREEDMQHDFYRPFFKAKMAGGISADGQVVSWIAKNAGDPLFKILNRDFSSAIGFSDFLYDIPNVSIRSVSKSDFGIPIGAWRSPGSNQNRFFTESFMDELAYAAGADPFAFRKAHLQKSPRGLAVMDEVEKMSNWGSPSVAGASQGVAYHEAHGSVIAMVVELSVQSAAVIFHKIYCAADCGTVVNPDILKAQIEGGVIFALSAALYGVITIESGRVQQSNFNDFRLMPLRDAPEVQTSIIPSTLKPGGVGELSVPPTAPAVTNAIYAATGQRIRTLPVNLNAVS